MSRIAQAVDGNVGRISFPVLVSVVVAFVLAFVAPNAKADINDGLYLHYSLTQESGTTVTDLSGNGRNGTASSAAGWLGAEGFQFNGGGSSSGRYIQMPNNITAALASGLSVSFDVLVDQGATSTSTFIFNLGNPGAQNQMNGHLFITNTPDFRAAITSGWWSQEQQAVRNGELARNQWRRVTVTLGNGVMRLYENAAPVATNSNVTHTTAVFANGAGTSTANYIGRSAYSGDPSFQGRIRDFRIYNRVLTGDEVCTLSSAYVSQGQITNTINSDRDAIDLGPLNAVVNNLDLPTTGASGTTISWQSSNPSVISTTGQVTRPANGSPAAQVTLTATISFCGETATRQFNVTVPPLSDQGDADTAADALELHGLDDVRGNITLPTSGILGTTISWQSSAPNRISSTGIVNRPPNGSGDANVTLTATVTKGSGSAQRQFNAVVKELPPPAEPFKGYLFPYMVGEGQSNGEQIFFALSQGNNPVQWQTLNNGQPVLTSNIGEQGIRDPYVIRSPEGDKFFMIATDLRMYQSSSGSWDQVERTGSRKIIVWESTDLVNWTDRRLVEVIGPEAGNVWAPEAFWDEETGQYVVYWASAIYNQQTDPNHTQNPKPYQRMMYATTRDFRTFSPAQPWLDPGYRVIDSTMIKHNGLYYRFTKDERENSQSNLNWNQGPCGKRIFSDVLTSPLQTIVNPIVTPDPVNRIADCIGNQFGAGEGPTVFKSNIEDRWYLLIDYYGSGGYRMFESTNPGSSTWTAASNVQFPSPTPRHGTVLPITQEEWDRLLSTYQPNAYVASIAPISRTTTVGTAPNLPSSVTVTLGNGQTANRTVTWDPIPPSAYAQPGTFQVEGTVPNSYSVKAVANVTVEAVPVTGISLSPSSLDIDVDEQRTLVATITPQNATDGSVTWDVDDPDDAIVVNPLYAGAPQATVVGKGLGTATITASAGDGTVTASIEVKVRADTEILAQVAQPVQFGKPVTIVTNVNSAHGTPNGVLDAWIDNQLAGSTDVQNGAATLQLPGLPVGVHNVTLNFSNGGVHRNSQETVTLIVGKGYLNLKLSLSPKKVKANKRAKLKINAKSSSNTTGPVKIKVGKKTVKKKLKLKPNGNVTFKLPKLKKGTHKITVLFAGDDTTNAASKTIKLKVRKK